ncbi:MAG: DUF370 domain-containing protein [Clostridia bacterium]|nr:DUF370 domain-containing protein [Clostridia bacterium]
MKIEIFLHGGNNVNIRKNEIVAIFDIDKTSTHKVTRDFLEKAQKQGIVKNITDDIPRSFIVTEKNGKKTVYISQLSPATLKERI